MHATSPFRSQRPTVDLSVALCTYEGARWIGQLLDSIAAQERLPDELVVLDDRSSDDTVDIVRGFAATAPFEVRLSVNPERLGSTDNFASALEQCRGRFIALADQDDVWYPAKLRTLVEELEADPTVTLVFSDADLIDESGEPIGRRLWSTRLVGRTLRRRAVVPEELIARRALTTGCTMAVRRRAVAAALPFPAELDDDAAPMRHDRWLSLVSAAVGTVRTVPEALLGFRVHPSQETGVLVGAQLPRALSRAATATALGPVDRTAPSHRARGAQLDAAAARAEDLGDFEQAATLRSIAQHHRRRAYRAARATERISAVLDEARSGGYRHEPFAAGAVLSDLLRAARPGSASTNDAPQQEQS